jgi:hypothetical protein
MAAWIVNRASDATGTVCVWARKPDMPSFAARAARERRGDVRVGPLGAAGKNAPLP